MTQPIATDAEVFVIDIYEMTTHIDEEAMTAIFLLGDTDLEHVPRTGTANAEIHDHVFARHFERSDQDPGARKGTAANEQPGVISERDRIRRGCHRHWHGAGNGEVDSLRVKAMKKE